MIAAMNILLILGLLYVYLRNMMKIRSGFTLGLALFAGLFLVQNIMVLYFGITMMPLYAEGLGGFMLAFTLLQTLAFIIMNWVTWK